jgi:dipeptidyl aminopeptidase/acylaminoacyl peptidase
MTVQAPSRPRGPDEPLVPMERADVEALEALIEEARQRARRRRRRNGAIALLLALAATAAAFSLLGRKSSSTPGAQAAQPAAVSLPPSPAGMIAFSASRGYSDDRVKVLLWSRAGVSDPHIRGWVDGWSPDGSRLLVARPGGIYSVRPDGGSVRLAAHGDARNAAWSPDGTELALEGHRVPGHRHWHQDLWHSHLHQMLVVGSDGRGLRRLRGWASDGGPINSLFAGNLAWSPDGHDLVFAGRTASDRRLWLYRVAADGRTPPRPLAIDARVESPLEPTWSPDGSRLAFSALVLRHDGPYVSGVYVMTADGSSVRRVAFDASGPVWSPDGSMLAFRGNGWYGTVHADGTQRHKVVAGGSWSGLSWSPDSRYLTFAGRSGAVHNGDVFAVHPDGTGLTRILHRPGFSISPLWRHGTATTEG